MGRRKNYPWDSRVDKKMTNLVSGIFATLITLPFKGVTNGLGSNRNPKMTTKEETIWVIIIALIASYWGLQLLFDPLFTGFVICIPIFLFVAPWICVFFQIRRYYKSKNKKKN